MKSGWDINEQDRYDISALMLAAVNGRATTVVELLARGAKIEDRDKADRTAMMKAEGFGHLPVMEIIQHSSIIQQKELPDSDIACLPNTVWERLRIIIGNSKLMAQKNIEEKS